MVCSQMFLVSFAERQTGNEEKEKQASHRASACDQKLLLTRGSSRSVTKAILQKVGVFLDTSAFKI